MRRYYQVGGYKANIHPTSYSQKRTLLDIVYDRLQRDDGGVELFLGIKLSGTSHLLVSEEDAARLRGETRCNSSLLSSDFESISPLVFRDKPSLEKKFDTLSQPANKNKKKKGIDRDLSRANKVFVSSSQEGLSRGQFENARRVPFHQRCLSTNHPDRVLYRLATDPGAAPKYDLDLTGFPLNNEGRTLDIPIYCFAYNIWNSDSRSLENRTREPRFLDVAWGEAPALDQRETADTMKTLSHIREKSSANLQQRNLPMKAFEWADVNGPTELLNLDDIRTKIGNFFEPLSRPSASPAILLVHNKSTALNVNSSAKMLATVPVKHLETLATDQRIILLPETVLARHVARRLMPTATTATADAPPSPPPRRLFAPLYVIDVENLYSTLSRTTATGLGTLPDIMLKTKLYEKVDCDGWCAGNELWMLRKVFMAMAEKGGVDDQDSEWPGGLGQMSTTFAIGGYDDEASDYGSEEDD
ncbi:hypothetical protein MIND_01388200 [Mycena indigotica]|uniref:Uncharacterized protein n=1 Tax=Mycena indigotica TaxID=2126181 RepID=A0A8H6RYF4_9AGAR|nr:uncharacterized protein MIND_01388200 [Mycena indigotica]KAF7289266.1 hypothetical protein MIND_01388200 [Mycena indigotica]